MRRRHLAFLVIMAVGLTGCTTSMIYAKDKKDGVYFTMPNGWAKISQTQLSAREAQSKTAGAADRLALVTWQEAYSLKGDLKPEDIFSLKAPKSPMVYVRVRELNIDEVQSVSYNSLRDIIVPLTDWINKSTADHQFNLKDDFEVVQKNSRGVRSIYSFAGSDGLEQTVDQTAFVSNDRSKIYVLLVRATASEFKSLNKVLTKIADSFTIRGAK